MSRSTLCKNCVFETLPLECFAGRIDQLKKSPDAIVKEENHHYVIENKICDFFSRRDKHLNNEDLVQLFVEIRTNKILKIPFIIDAYDATIEQVEQTIHSLQNQTIKPPSIHIVSNNDFLIYAQSLNRTQNIPATASIIYEDSLEKFIDRKVSAYRTTYYGKVKAGKQLDKNLIEKLDILYNNDMKHFVYYEGDNFSIRSVLLSMIVGSDYLENENGLTYKDKITAWCLANNKDHLLIYE